MPVATATATLPAADPGPRRTGAHVTARRLSTVHSDGTSALDDVSVTVRPGELTAVIGPSGAGKTTLLTALAGVAPADSGAVAFECPGRPTGEVRVGYVPQADILHDELPLRRTLGYAGALRLATASQADVDAAVENAMATLGLADHADVPVSSLSGGQRKRASIATELVTRPDVCFLDEPTSGLDPAASSRLMEFLRRMCAAGATVAFTTHSVQDIEQSDRVVVLAPGGRLVATGRPADVLADLGAGSFPELFVLLDEGGSRGRAAAVGRHRPRRPIRQGGGGPGRVRQWQVLTRRAAETVVRNRLTMAIMLGSPAAVIAMFSVLFEPGAFAPTTGPSAAPMVAYWLAFAGFFFGVTFGLLQVSTEVPMLRREHHAGVRTGPYLLSKLTVLTPFLLVVNAAMLAVLRVLDRLPALPPGVLAKLLVTMALNAVAALALGLLASASVRSTAQAALALPMLCFPAVLFAGAMVPVSAMPTAGRGIAAVMPDRWAFEAIARHLDVADAVGPASVHAGLGVSPVLTYWMLLAGFTAVLLAGAYVAVRARAVSRDH